MEPEANKGEGKMREVERKGGRGTGKSGGQRKKNWAGKKASATKITQKSTEGRPYQMTTGKKRS